MHPNVQYYPHNDINSLSANHKVFSELLHARLTSYSSGDKQGLWKTDYLPKRFVLLRHVKTISTIPVFQ